MLFQDQNINIDEIVAGARKWDNLYLRSTNHAVELYEDPHEVEHVIQEFLSGRNKGAFKLTNPFSKRIWLRELLIAFYGRKESQAQSWHDDGDRVPLVGSFVPWSRSPRLQLMFSFLLERPTTGRRPNVVPRPFWRNMKRDGRPTTGGEALPPGHACLRSACPRPPRFRPSGKIPPYGATVLNGRCRASATNR